MRSRLVQEKRTDHSAGRCLGKKVQQIRAGRQRRFGASVVHRSSALLPDDDSLSGVFRQLLPDGGLVEHLRVPEFRQVFVDPFVQPVQRQRGIRIVQNVEKNEMQRDIPVRKAFRFPRGVQRIVPGNAAVDGEKDVFSPRRLPEPHIIAKPALHPAAFVVIGAGAFLCVFVPAFKSIKKELPHIIADSVEIPDQFVICHALPSFLYGRGGYRRLPRHVPGPGVILPAPPPGRARIPWAAAPAAAPSARRTDERTAFLRRPEALRSGSARLR